MAAVTTRVFYSLNDCGLTRQLPRLAPFFFLFFCCFPCKSQMGKNKILSTAPFSLWQCRHRPFLTHTHARTHAGKMGKTPNDSGQFGELEPQPHLAAVAFNR